MAKTGTSRKNKKPTQSTAQSSGGSARQVLRSAGRWAVRGIAVVCVFVLLITLVYRFVPVPITPYMLAERVRHGSLEKDWVPAEDIAPVMMRAAVAAEDANFCLHWGFDMAAIRGVIESGQSRGASSISQQVAKNVFLWQGRSWPRKALEALMTPVVEAFWPKRRILEIYLNVAEFDRGVFGVEAAAQHYFGISAKELAPWQAGRLAAILPDPKGRSASQPSNFVTGRADAIVDGAATIQADGRADCFERA